MPKVVHKLLRPGPHFMPLIRLPAACKMAVLLAGTSRLAPPVIYAGTGSANRLLGHWACREAGDRPLCIKNLLLPACRL